MKEKDSKSKLFEELHQLYSRMEATYNRAAEALGLSCDGCPVNCCSSYFQHHTYIEWAYLWEGMMALPAERRQMFVKRARDYVGESQVRLVQGKPPRIMCPLNEDGLCQVYEHRLMICRMHGVPNSFERPDGETMQFPGCVPCQELYGDLDDVPLLDRTPFYKDLASLEMAILKAAGTPLPKVKLTLAEMLVQGPPGL